MNCPRTDEEWERLAECIVTKHPSVSPELVGGITVYATQTIFTWYKGEERRKALDERQYARDRLMGFAREAGCMSEGRTWAEELAWREKSGFGELHRPFPETYGDWVDLGMDIKEKAGIDDIETTTLVNRHLNHIYEEEQDPAIAQTSKQWLTNKAGELEIR